MSGHSKWSEIKRKKGAPEKIPGWWTIGGDLTPDEADRAKALLEKRGLADKSDLIVSDRITLRWHENKSDAERIATLEAEVAALREALEQVITADDGHSDALFDLLDPDFGKRLVDLLSQPFDLAAHQERAARERLTEERLAEAMMNGLTPGRRGDKAYEKQHRYHAAAILTELFGEPR